MYTSSIVTILASVGASVAAPARPLQPRQSSSLLTDINVIQTYWGQVRWISLGFVSGPHPSLDRSAHTTTVLRPTLASQTLAFQMAAGMNKVSRRTTASHLVSEQSLQSMCFIVMALGRSRGSAAP